MSAHEISPGAHDSAAETAGLSRSEWIRRCCAEATTALIDAAGHDLDDARHQWSAVNQPGQRRSPEAVEAALGVDAARRDLDAWLQNSSCAPPWIRPIVPRKTPGVPPTPSRLPLRHTPQGTGLYVTGGVALVHIEGQAPQHLTKGESIWIDAGQRHWHGAALKQPMIHLTYQQAANDLSTIDWQEPVTPTTYSHETKENR